VRAGVFGGCYFHPRGGKAGIFGRDVAVSHTEFPKEWFLGVPEKMYKKCALLCFLLLQSCVHAMRSTTCKSRRVPVL
jgi:hypothetical protein